ncbi:MAG: hypothetical protein U0703_15415 [Anaerolineae bacterium]
MLRFSITVSLLLMSGFTLVGGLLFHQWGWSEYASDALYIVYYQIKPAPFPFFIVNTDGGSDPAQLVATDATLTGLDCSPDGRTLAFVTDSARLYVVNQAGALCDRALDHAYPSLSVANNGTVALFTTLGGAPAITTCCWSMPRTPLPLHAAGSPPVHFGGAVIAGDTAVASHQRLRAGSHVADRHPDRLVFGSDLPQMAGIGAGDDLRRHRLVAADARAGRPRRAEKRPAEAAPSERRLFAR